MDAARYGQLVGAGAGTKGRKDAVTNPAPATIKRVFNILSDPARIRQFQVACRSAPSKMAAMIPIDKRAPPPYSSCFLFISVFNIMHVSHILLSVLCFFKREEY
jgi:hypothetical protein